MDKATQAVDPELEVFTQRKIRYAIFNLEKRYFDLPEENWLVEDPIRIFDRLEEAIKKRDQINEDRKRDYKRKTGQPNEMSNYRYRGLVGIKSRVEQFTDWKEPKEDASE